MEQERVRILKLLVYEGPRNVLEDHVKNTVFNRQTYHNTKLEGEYSVTGYSLVAFPELILPEQEIKIK